MTLTGKFHQMLKRSLFFFLFAGLGCSLQVGAQVKSTPPASQGLSPVIPQHIPRWVRKVNLSPNESLYIQSTKEVKPLTGRPILKMNAAVHKSALIENGDSILMASQEFSKQISKRRLFQKKPREILLSTLYFDRACLNAGLSRRITYLIKGRTCTMLTDSSFDDSWELDTAIAGRMQSFFLLPTQFLIYDAAGKAIILKTITPKCVKDWYYRSDPENTPAVKVTYRVLFEIVQHDFPKITAVGCGCAAPHGEYRVEATGMFLKHDNLRTQYDSIYKAYLKGKYL